jgi:hypothetical protein
MNLSLTNVDVERRRRKPLHNQQGVIYEINTQAKHVSR